MTQSPPNFLRSNCLSEFCLAQIDIPMMGPYSIWICVYLYMKTLGKNHPLICTVNISQSSFHGDPCPGIGFSKKCPSGFGAEVGISTNRTTVCQRIRWSHQKNLDHNRSAEEFRFFFRMLQIWSHLRLFVCLYVSIIELCQSFSLEWTSCGFVDVIWHCLVVAMLIYFGHQYFNTPHATRGHRKNGRLLSFTCKFVYWLALFCMGCIPDFARVQLHKIL